MVMTISDSPTAYSVAPDNPGLSFPAPGHSEALQNRDCAFVTEHEIDVSKTRAGYLNKDFMFVYV